MDFRLAGAVFEFHLYGTSRPGNGLDLTRAKVQQVGCYNETEGSDLYFVCSSGLYGLEGRNLFIYRRTQQFLYGYMRRTYG